MPNELLERFILDPSSETADGAFEVSGGMVPDPEGHGFGLIEIGFPRPEVNRNWAGSRNTEGERPATAPRYMNRRIPVKVVAWESKGVGPSTNLVVNPSFEGSTASWATTGGALTSGGTLTRVPGGCAGEYSGQLVAGAANHGAGISATLAASTAYKLRFGAKRVTGSVASLTAARASTGLGSVTLTDSWQMFEVDVPATTAGAHFFSLRANAAGTFLIDAVSIQAATDPTKYFDGDTPGCVWTGPIHGSTSTRRGTGDDLKRFMSCVNQLESKLEKLARKGGVAARYTPDGTRIVFDVLDATYPADWQRSISQGRMELNFELTCKPFARQSPYTVSTVTKAASTSVATVNTGTVPGNAPALVRLAVTDTGTAQRNYLLTGSAQRSDPAMLLAKTRQLLGGALANSPTSAATTNGGSTNGTVKMTMNAAWRPILSTNDSGPTYQTHEGIQRVLARVYFPSSNTADASLKFEWAQADLARWNTSDLIDGSKSVTITGAAQTGSWQWVDFGTVNLTKPRSDVFRDSAGWKWEGRLTAKAASGDIYVDAFAVIPAANFMAEMFANPQSPELNDALIGLDTGAGSGNLAGSAAAVGGNWSEVGGGTSYQRDAPSGRITRLVATSDAAFKFARLGTATQAAVQAIGTVGHISPGTTAISGLLVRYVDASNYALATVTYSPTGNALAFWAVKAGSPVLLPMVALPSGPSAWKLTLVVNSNGSGGLSAISGSDIRWVSWAANSDLATGGALASGGFGIAHRATTAAGDLSTWQNLEFRSLTSTVVDDAVIFPGRSAILSHDNALRYNSAGDTLGEIGRYQGDRLMIPAGASSRIAILDGRVQPGASDNNLDQLTVDLTIVPRVLDVPDPA